MIIPLALSEMVQVIGFALYRCGVVAVSTLVDVGKILNPAKNSVLSPLTRGF